MFRRALKELDTVRRFCLSIDLTIFRRDKDTGGHKDDCPQSDSSTGIALNDQFSTTQLLRARNC
jgi:hypothetical protein